MHDFDGENFFIQRMHCILLYSNINALLRYQFLVIVTINLIQTYLLVIWICHATLINVNVWLGN